MLKENAPDSYEKARGIIDYYREKYGIEIVPKKTLHVKLTIPQNGRQVSAFYIDKKAKLWVCPNVIAGSLPSLTAIRL